MAKTIDAADMRDIASGATFLGAGGGGSLSSGAAIVDELVAAGKAQVTVIDCSEMGDSEWAVSLAEIGSPRTFQNDPTFPEAVVAFRALQKALAPEGREIRYLVPGEVGGLNTIVPLYAAAMENLPIVDADGTGRAVPELSTTLYQVYDILPVPLTMAGRNGDSFDSVVIHLGNPQDQSTAENIARYVSVAYGMRAAFCTWPVKRETIQECLVPGSLSLCLEIGKALKKADSVEELSALLSAITGAKMMIKGQITKLETKAEKGFDFGTTVITGASGKADDRLTIDVKNENILARDGSGKVIATVPDLISVVDIDSMTPLSNADTAEGQNVAVYGMRAHANWLRHPQGFGCWKPLLNMLGYTGGYVSVG